MAERLFIETDASGVVLSARKYSRADTVPDPLPDHWHETDDAGLLEQATQRVGRAKLQDGALVNYTPPAPPPQPYAVSKLLVVARLTEVGKLRAAYTALKLEAPMSELSDDELALRETWLAATEVINTDQRARLLLQAIGADVDAILAPPEA